MLRLTQRALMGIGDRAAANLGRLHGMLPARIRPYSVWVDLLPEEEWLPEWGDTRGWTSGGNIHLRRGGPGGGWRSVPGLFMHEQGHALDQILGTNATRAQWTEYIHRHPERRTDYRPRQSLEQLAEATVRVYQRPLPRGYRSADKETAALVRSFYGG